MTLTFSILLEQMESGNGSPLMDSGEETRAASVIRAGLDLHGEDESSFWEEFSDLCSNSDGMADLLGVSSEQVAGWPAKIRDKLDHVEKHDAESPSMGDENEVMPTGDSGAIVFPDDNVDPYMGEL
jgi:hypothetical protein